MGADGGLSDYERILELIRSLHPLVAVTTVEEAHALALVEQAVSATLLPMWTWTAVGGVQAGLLRNPKAVPDTEHPAAALFHLASSIDSPAVCVMLDLAPHLDDARTLRALRELTAKFRSIDATLILVDHDDRLPRVVAVEATRLELQLPSDDELEEIVRTTLRPLLRGKKLAVKLSKRELEAFVRNLRGLTREQARQLVIDATIGDRQLDAGDLHHVLAAKRSRLQQDGLLEFIEAPVDLDEIGGLGVLKKWLRDRRSAFSAGAEGDAGLTPPRGVLLLGVPGAGKSLSAKAIATAWKFPLLRLDPGVLYNRYIGESERRLRDALHQAEMMAPIILWIDEIEKGFASASSHAVDGGLSQRMFGTMLTWMQDHRAPVFLVATANDIAALPPPLIRRGRFDQVFFIDLPKAKTRRLIFEIHLRKRGQNAESFDLDALAHASEGCSGAEIEQAIVSALHEAHASGDAIDDARLLDSLRRTVPLSVTMAEHIHRLRQWAHGRCLPAE